jgi:RHS repeat-associated protein
MPYSTKDYLHDVDPSRGVTVALDRLGSNQSGGSHYFPYREEQQLTAQDRDKFATYHRDGTTGLDYAQNRYYASTLGRFISPDPYKASVGGKQSKHGPKCSGMR